MATTASISSFVGPLGHFVEPVKKFRRKPISRHIYRDRGQVFLACCRYCSQLVAVFCGTESAIPAKYARKVLLRFKAACQGDIQDTGFRDAQHLLRTLYSVA